MKTILITGGTRGIGLATALRFSENNWNVYITSRKEENLSAVLSEHPSLKGFVANADSEEAAVETCAAIVSETNSLDVLIIMQVQIHQVDTLWMLKYLEFKKHGT